MVGKLKRGLDGLREHRKTLFPRVVTHYPAADSNKHWVGWRMQPGQRLSLKSFLRQNLGFGYRDVCKIGPDGKKTFYRQGGLGFAFDERVVRNIPGRRALTRASWNAALRNSGLPK